MSQITVTCPVLQCQPDSSQTSIGGQSGSTGILLQTPGLLPLSSSDYHLSSMEAQPKLCIRKPNVSFLRLVVWAELLSCIFPITCIFLALVQANIHFLNFTHYCHFESTRLFIDSTYGTPIHMCKTSQSGKRTYVSYIQKCAMIFSHM